MLIYKIWFFLYLLARTCTVVEILFWHQKLNSWVYVLHKVPSYRNDAYQFWLKLHALCMGTIRIKVLWSLFLSILCTLYVHMYYIWLQFDFKQFWLKQGWSQDFFRNQESLLWNTNVPAEWQVRFAPHGFCYEQVS